MLHYNDTYEYWRFKKILGNSETRPLGVGGNADGTGAEAGRIHIPSQMFRPAESVLVFRIFRKMGSDCFKQTPPSY